MPQFAPQGVRIQLQRPENCLRNRQTPPATRQRPPTPTLYADFGAALKAWLLQAARSQRQLAHVLKVNPSTVTTWALGQKRPDPRSLVKLLAHFRGWLGANWDPLEALDAMAGLGYDWSQVEEALVRHFQPGGILRPSRAGGRKHNRRRGGSISRRGRSATSRAALNTI